MHLPVCVKNKSKTESRKRVVIAALILRRSKLKRHRSMYVRELFQKRTYHGEYFLLKT